MPRTSALLVLALVCSASTGHAAPRSEPWRLGVLGLEQRPAEAKAPAGLYLTITTLERQLATRYVLPGKVSREGKLLRVVLGATRRAEQADAPGRLVADFATALPDDIGPLTVELVRGDQTDRYRFDIGAKGVEVSSDGELHFSRWRGGSFARTATAEEADQPWPVAVITKTSATSSGKGEDGAYLPRHAFDGYDTPGTSTSWCTADTNAKGQSVSVSFAPALALDHVQLDVDKHVRGIEIVTDAGTVPAARDERGVFGATLSGTTRSVSVRITEIDETAARPVCVTVVSFSQDHQAVVLLSGVPPAAASKVRTAFAAAGAALRSCKPDAIARVATFPVEYDYIGGGDQTAHGKLASAAKMAALCRARGSLGEVTAQSEPRTFGRPGAVAVDAGDGYRWIFSWLGGGWRLRQIEGTGPSRH